MTAEVAIAPMQESHLAQVAELERIAGDVRWSLGQVTAELAKPISRYYVAIDPVKQVVGYVGGWVVEPELQIANIVIHPDFRCRGLGRRLLQTLIQDAKAQGCSQATLEVRAGNAHAQALYRAAGFVENGRRPGLYQNPVEDGLLMEKTF